jgi:putative peptide zinc metalloprotease protein
VAVAVAFQVVLVMDNAHVVAPQNLAVAANYDCYRCITAAIASQLILSVDTEPGEEELVALADVWSRLVQFARNITSYSLTQVAAQLETFKAEIVAILDEAAVVQPEPSPSTTASPGTAEDPSGPSSSAPTPAPATSPSPTATGAGTSAPSPTDETTAAPPSPTPTSSEGATATTPSPTPSSAPEATGSPAATSSP